VGKGVVCYVFNGGGAERCDDLVDFWGCERMGYFEGCEVHVLDRHEPKFWVGGEISYMIDVCIWMSDESCQDLEIIEWSLGQR